MLTVNTPQCVWESVQWCCCASTSHRFKTIPKKLACLWGAGQSIHNVGLGNGSHFLWEVQRRKTSHKAEVGAVETANAIYRREQLRLQFDFGYMTRGSEQRLKTGNFQHPWPCLKSKPSLSKENVLLSQHRKAFHLTSSGRLRYHRQRWHVIASNGNPSHTARPESEGALLQFSYKWKVDSKNDWEKKLQKLHN